MNAPTPQNATSPANHSALPERVIERIFAEMLAMYGAKFSDLWRSADIADVKAMWARKLAGFESTPNVFRAALNALDDRPFPPTLPEFLSLCREAARRMGTSTPLLTHKVDHARQAEFAEKLKAIVSSQNRGSDPIFLSTHPRSHLAFRYIQGAAKNDPERFQPCIDKLIADGIVSPEGRLLRRYRGNGVWETA